MSSADAQMRPVHRLSAAQRQPAPKVFSPIARLKQLRTTAAKVTMNLPYGLCIGPNGTIYVANILGNRVTKYGAGYGFEGAVSGGMNGPAAVATSFSGNLFVANNGGNNVTVYNTAGSQTGTITDGTLVNPVSMFIDADDTVWVLDSNGVLHNYLYTFQPLSSNTIGGSAVGPWGPNWAVWGVATSTLGAFDEYFQNIGEADHYGIAPDGGANGSPLAGGEAEDSTGQQWITDTQNNDVQVHTADDYGAFVAFTTPAAPYGIAVDSARKRVYVSIPSLEAVYVYGLTGSHTLLHIIK